MNVVKDRTCTWSDEKNYEKVTFTEKDFVNDAEYTSLLILSHTYNLFFRYKYTLKSIKKIQRGSHTEILILLES